MIQLLLVDGFVVAQANAVRSDVVATIAAAIALVLTILLAWQFRRFDRQEAEMRALKREVAARLAQAEPNAGESPPTAADPRGQIMFEQHRRLNDLQIAKLSAELELLKRQIDRKAEEADRMEAGKEVHELMVEKTRLEIDNLRLHLVELRKRAEDWGTEG